MYLKNIYIPPDKLANYLLDLKHPSGGPKAIRLYQAGFCREEPEVLEQALYQLVAFAEAVEDRPSSRGDECYAVFGPLCGPAGIVHVKTIWQVNGDQTLFYEFSFVTLKPIKRWT